jgi:hypothetical protein
MLGHLLFIIIYILLFILISIIFDKTEKKGIDSEEDYFKESDNTIKRSFSWVMEDNLRSYELQCDIIFNKETVIEAKKDLLNIKQPSKIVFTSFNDYLNITKFQVLHENFGYGCREIEQITNYLIKYANDHYFSNYQIAVLILSFVQDQNIKFSEDEDSTGYLEYLRYPIETIYDKTGDCDCKTILACALFKRLGFRVAFAIMPGHAALAISMNTVPFFSNFKMNGAYWFYCETTGDDWKPGQIPDIININEIYLEEI